MAKPEDTRPLPDGNFRATRAFLADHVFLVPGGGKEPPNDLMERSEWDQFMDLPTDVLLRTTEYLGSMVGDMVARSAEWIEVTPIAPSVAPFIFDAALDAADEFDAAPFIAAHGYYRQAIAGLRNALEVMTHAACFASRNDQPGFQAWRAATKEAPKFGNSVDMLRQQKTLADADQFIGQPGLFGAKPDGVLRTLYAHLSRYAHGQRGYTNPDIWRSNGPVFSGRAFTQFWKDYGDTVSACYVLLKIGYPELVLP